MAIICDICKVRPATARVAFMRDGQHQVVDVCASDFQKLQSGNPSLISNAISKSMVPQPYTKNFITKAADVAAEFGQHEIASEHLLVALVNDDASHEYFEALNINPSDVHTFIMINALHDVSHTDTVQLSSEARSVLEGAAECAEELDELPHVGHILFALSEDRGMAGDFLRKIGVTPDVVREMLEEEENEEIEETGTKTLEKYSRDLTRLAKQGKLDPVIGREQEIETTIEVLSRRTKNNPVLVGEPGVGKTAIVEGLAQKVVEGSVPASLKNKKVVELNLTSMVAGSKFRGEFEERLHTVLKEITANKDTMLVFLDELHTVVGAGSGEGSLDAANVIKPALARGDLHLIGATTLNEYQKYIEKDAALERRFQTVMVNEPNLADAQLILKGLKPKYEEHHKVKINDSAVKAAVELSDRYMTQRFLPDKAIDLIDQASARARIQAGDDIDLVITDKHIAEMLAKLTGIPVTEVTQEEKERLLKLEDRLHERVIGQDDAVKSVAQAIRISRAGLSKEHSPIATFLFLGPTGVGKTELAKALAADMFGSEQALTRIDMSEYMERHSVSRLVGSPPGYVGYDEGGQLTEAVRRHPYGVILLDEIEKAHPEVANILLQVFDDGRLTDGKGRTVDFSNTIIIATSNLGTSSEPQAKIGFQTREQAEEQKSDIVEQLKEHFRPEFINRIDEVIAFRTLTTAQTEKIVTLQLEQLAKRVASQGLTLRWTPAVVEHFAKAGFDPRFGARELARTIKRELENKLADMLLQVSKAKRIASVDYKKDKLVLV